MADLKKSSSTESLKSCSDQSSSSSNCSSTNNKNNNSSSRSNSDDELEKPPETRVLKPKVILLAFEGTMAPLDVEDKVVMPYLKANLLSYLQENYGQGSVFELVDTLKAMSFHDHFVQSIEEAPLIVDFAVNGTNIVQVLQSVVDYTLWKLYRPERAPLPVLLLIQGCWEKGYSEGKLKTIIFADVLPSILKWKSLGIRVVVFDAVPQSQCRLMLSSTMVGNVAVNMETFLDQENAGPRNDPKSYDAISSKLSVPKADLLFVCHYGQDVKTAAEAGVKVVLLTRAGNPRNRTYYTLRYTTADTMQQISFV